MGGGNLYSLDQTGGSSNVILPSHTHTGSTNTFSHAHTGLGGQLSGGFFGSINGRNVKTQGTTGNGGHSHSELTSSTIGEADGTGRNIPPYYALAYIMYGGN